MTMTTTTIISTEAQQAVYFAAYDQLKVTILKEYDITSWILMIPLVMRAVGDAKALTGPERKTVALALIVRFVSELPFSDEGLRAVVLSMVPSVGGVAIDLLYAAGSAAYGLFEKVENRLNLLQCCKPSSSSSAAIARKRGGGGSSAGKKRKEEAKRALRLLTLKGIVKTRFNTRGYTSETWLEVLPFVMKSASKMKGLTGAAKRELVVEAIIQVLPTLSGDINGMSLLPYLVGTMCDQMFSAAHGDLRGVGSIRKRDANIRRK